ncbi:unnamed protein product [Prorocentrum cordatum]|uniref:Uncharacterized protein n=1 Tax=Prorocentrum cordatum TaxID=2364126 RepID=A0ABN9XH52_9DINO|nr:unnamed protein product [Polarella glacialis]
MPFSLSSCPTINLGGVQYFIYVNLFARRLFPGSAAFAAKPGCAYEWRVALEWLLLRARRDFWFVFHHHHLYMLEGEEVLLLHLRLLLLLLFVLLLLRLLHLLPPPAYGGGGGKQVHQ